MASAMLFTELCFFHHVRAQFDPIKAKFKISILITVHSMSKKLFVGNISWNATDEQLKELFETHGEVEEAVIIKDKFSGRSKGFGFVTFVNDADGDAATEALNGHELDGRELTVNEAKPREER